MADDEETSEAPGWEAIDAALDAIYDDVEPLHWGNTVPWEIGGADPLRGISAYRNQDGRPHLHYVTFGFSELFAKESKDLAVSGYGFELTFRLACKAKQEPPEWVLDFLQNLARYVFETGNAFGVGHTLPFNGPICVGTPTQIRAGLFVQDRALKPIQTPNGRVEFLQLVGLTEDELAAIECWSATGFAKLIAEKNSLFLTDLNRPSLLSDPAFAEQVRLRTEREGAVSDAMFADKASLTLDNAKPVLTIGAILALAVRNRLRGRIPFGREFTIYTEQESIRFEPAERFTVEPTTDGHRIRLTRAQSDKLCQVLEPRGGTYRLTDPPGMTVVIEPTPIKDPNGRVTHVVG